MFQRFSVVSDANVQERLHFDVYVMSCTSNMDITEVVTRLIERTWNDIVQHELARPHKDKNVVRASIEHFVPYWCTDRLRNWNTGSAPGYFIQLLSNCLKIWLQIININK